MVKSDVIHALNLVHDLLDYLEKDPDIRPEYIKKERKWLKDMLEYTDEMRE